MFQAVYTPEKKVAIDEAMIPWRGKLRFKVYVKNKPTKWGIKIYELCESSSAYLYNFEIYAADARLSNRPVDVCNRLLEPLTNQGYWLYTDNYYTCPELTKQLIAKGTMSIGTVRCNRRGMPYDLRNLKLKKGESSYRRQGDMAVLKWQDKRDVTLLSTVHDPTKTVVHQTRTATTNKPIVVADYTSNMCGVDKSDQLLAYVPMNRRSVKWWKKVFLHLYTLTVVQCHILHNKICVRDGRKPIKLPQFMLNLGQALTQEYFALPGVKKPSGGGRRKSTLGTIDRLCSNTHFMYDIPPTPNNNRPRRRCQVCSVKYQKNNPN